MEEKTVILRDEVQVHTETWTPESPIACIVFVHGLGEHIGRYRHVFSALHDSGIKVHSWDQRGFGKSKDLGTWPPCHLGNRDVIMEDVSEAIERAKIPDKPLYLYGHSMGGLIVLDYATSKKKPISGVISSAPALGIPEQNAPNPLKVKLGSIAGNLFPSFAIATGIQSKNLTHDEALNEQYDADPLNVKNASLSTIKYILNQGQEILLNPNLPEIRLLMFHGDKDPITCPLSSKQYFEKVKLTDKTIHLYENYYHELHNEPDVKDTVIRMIIDWIKK